MRLLISEVDVPFGTALPVHANVPGMLLDDELFMLICAAFDELLTPDVTALDCFPAYLDTALTPDDFLPWLGALVGAEPDREQIAGATASYAERGTAAGLQATAAQAADVALGAVTVKDPGGVTWSTTPGSATAIEPRPALIRVQAPTDTATAEMTESVRAALEPSRPVHCPIEVEVVTT
jgi:phage tail-like protein